MSSVKSEYQVSTLLLILIYLSKECYESKKAIFLEIHLKVKINITLNFIWDLQLNGNNYLHTRMLRK